MSVDKNAELLKDALIRIRTLRAKLEASEQARNEPIAIVGIGCRFPGGIENPDDYWRVLQNGVDTISEIPSRRWDVEKYWDRNPDAPGKMYVRHGGFLGEVETFDADFFGISAREAVTLDPQQRLMLEVSWEALENAGVAPDRLSGSLTGVYVGIMNSDYALRQAHNIDSASVDPYMLTGNDLSFPAGRLAYFLGLQGPAMVVATACSSSLVSVHLACQALRGHECDQALAGGINLILDPVTNVMLSKLRALSPDGRCKTFDAAADGYGRGEGCGVVVLKRLSDAQANGDRIIAVIRGSAINHDGPSAGLTVPNGGAQEKLLHKALQSAGVAPNEVAYVEAHGTGTSLGDPIELQSLAKAMGEGRETPLLVGSAKTNLGHLEAAAGIAGLIKTALALDHGKIPPHLHFKNPNPNIAWNELPVRVVTELREWPAEYKRRIAGVNSFGLSGANAHIVLEEAPAASSDRVELDGRAHVLTLSARSEQALKELVARYDDHLSRHPELSWADVCYTAKHGRAQLEHRVSVVATSIEEARTRLRDGGSTDLAEAGETFSGRRVALPTYPFQRQRYWALDNKGPALVSSAVQAAVQAEQSGSLPELFEKQVARVLGLRAMPDREVSLLELGVDSLMSTELRTWLRQKTGVDLDTREFLSGASIAGILSRLGETEEVVQQYPLSYGQKALWFIHQSDPQSPAYNVGIALRARSEIDTDALRSSLQHLVDRHASLRARFPSVDGEPAQVVPARDEIRFDIVDAAGLSEDELTHRLSESQKRPFDLLNGPIFRASLYSQSQSEHVLLLAMHHIGCDALTFWTLLEDLQNSYAALKAGGSLHVAPPASSYSEFVEWQSEMLSGEEGGRLWAWWQRRLSGQLPVLDLPLDFARPAVQTFNGTSHRIDVPQGLAQALKALSHERKATLYTTLLAAFHVLLHRYTGQEDIIVGSATSGRTSRFAGVAGYFVNPVPIRADLSGNPDFVSFLEQVRQTAFDALDHQQLPFPLLVERLQPKRDGSRSPVFQVDFALRKHPPLYRHAGERSDLALPFEAFELPEEEGQFDISLHITEEEHGLSASFKYDRDLFRASTIARMAECYLTLLDGIVDDPNRRVSEIPILTAAERTRILAAGAGPSIVYPDLCVHQMFERQVERTPNAIAVESGDGQSLTYRMLDTRANQLANYLVSLGVGPEVLTGVLLERSLDLVVGMLAVLKASGAYLPLDPGYPEERLSFLMRDAGIPVLLTTRNLAARVSASEYVRVVCLDDEQNAIAQFDSGNLPNLAQAENLAYVIYTSGSTGKPKGTEITHRGFTNYISWAVDAYRVAEGCGAPVSTSIGFDATITSIWTPLMTGGRVILLGEENTIESLGGTLRSSRDLSLLKITPAHLEILSQMVPASECAGRANAFVIGGEALRPDMLSFWKEAAPSTRLINEYGPTETVVGCCIYEATGAESKSVPIGRAIANTRLYVLDRNLEPVPFGVTGELYIGGAGVARGYLKRPGLSGSRFVPDPFSGEHGACLYRTGDLVRFLPDGNLDFLGRIDTQVKIRGYRIELGEIESVLSQHPGVADCAVLVWDEPANPRLAAYVVGASEAVPVPELRRHLAEKLPEYMVPASIAYIDALPLTPNGKIDRKALPKPEASSSSSKLLAPRDPLEMKLAAIWEDVLGHSPVGVKDNFFELGGHSLLAVRLMSRVQQEFEQDIPLAAILRGPTIEQMAQLLRRKGSASLRTSLVPIQPGGSRPPFFCVPGAGGNAIYLYNLARHLGPGQPFYGLQGVGIDGEDKPHTTVEAMAAHYIAAVQSAQPRGPYYLGGHSLGGWVAFEMAQQLQRRGEQVALVTIIDTPVPSPSALRDTSGWDSARWIAELATRISQLLNPALQLSADSLRGFTLQEQLEQFRTALVSTELFPGDGGIEHLRNVLEMFKAHSQVRYLIPDNPLPTRIALLRTAEPPAHLSTLSDDSAWGWSIAGEVDVEVVPGEHLSVLRPPHVEKLAEKIARRLSQAADAAREDLVLAQ